MGSEGRAGGLEEEYARFEKECRSRKLRITAQRSAVYRALAADPGHPTAEEVFDRLRDDIPGLSPATVYRILESFEREGFVLRVATPEGIGRFDANLLPHHHMVCRRCGQILDFDGEALGRLSLPATCPGGFAPERLEISVIGICQTCRSPETRRPRKHSL